MHRNTKTKSFPQLAAVFAASLLLAGHSAAATIAILPTTGITPSYQAPSGILIGGNPTIDPTGTSDQVRSNRDQGQTFVITTTGIIDKVALFVTNFVSTGTRDFTVNFFKVDPPTTSQADMTGRFGETTYDPAVLDSTPTITAASLVALGVSNGDNFTLVVDVADTAVTAGEVYAVQLNILNNGTDQILNLRYNTTFADGFGIGTSPQGDYHIAAYAIPEPSSLGLLLGGMLIALRRRRSS